MTRESTIQKLIEIELSRNHCTVFRTNVGRVRTITGGWFETGLPKGHPDLYGFRHSDKQVFYIEVKNEKGRPSPDQVRFHDFLTMFDVIHGIARSPEDALKIVKEGLVGYGFKKS